MNCRYRNTQTAMIRSCLRTLEIMITCLLGCSLNAGELEHIEQTSSNSLNAVFAGTVILSAETHNTNRSSLRTSFFPLWNPTTNDVTEAAKRFSIYLKDGDGQPFSHPRYAMELPGIRERLPKTLCQFVGVTFDGRKGILLNCIPPDTRRAKKWRESYVKVFDGGPQYWSVIYIPDERKFTQFQIDLGGF
jgi:hypothetical protein